MKAQKSRQIECNNEIRSILHKVWPLVIVLLLILVSCVPEEEVIEKELIDVEVKEEAYEIAEDDDPITPLLHECPADFTIPLLTSPVGDIIDPTPPQIFEWDIDCVPDLYHLMVYTLENQSAKPVYIIDTKFESNNAEYVSNVPLEPATTYWWKMDVKSNYFTEKTTNVSGFRTGPICTKEELVTPTIISPADGSFDHGKGWGIIQEVAAVLSYPVSSCMPTGYEYDLSQNPDFSGDELWSESRGPAICRAYQDGNCITEGDTHALEDCRVHFMRARLLIENDHGPWSEMVSFYTNFEDNCIFISKFIGLKNVNCRRDPWIGENHVGMIGEGETAELLGLNEDASWGFFKLQNERECWVNMSAVELQPPGAVFNPLFYPILDHSTAPADAAQPADSSSPPDSRTSQQGCMAPNRSGQLVCQVPCPDPAYASRVCTP